MTDSPRVSAEAVVVDAFDIGDGFERIVFEAAAFRELPVLRPGESVKVLLPPAGSTGVALPSLAPDALPAWPEGAPRPALRAFVVTAVDRGAGLLFVTLAHRPGSTLGARLRPGAQVGVAGMRFGVDLPARGRLLIVAERCALPSVSALLRALPPDASCELVLLLDDPGARGAIDVPPGVGVQVVRAVAPTELPAADWAWLGAEDGIVRAARRHLLDVAGLAPRNVVAVGHWREGLDADARDAVLQERFARAQAEGRPFADPVEAAAIEYD